VVVVTVTYPDRKTRRQVFAESFTVGTAGDSDLVLAMPQLAAGRVLTIDVFGPDVRIGRIHMQTSLRLNSERVDKDFVHVLHVGDELEVLGHTLTFELVEGTPDDVKRFTGEVSREPVAAELDLLAALRADPEDAAAREVYADWLDEHGRSGEAEFVRLQWLARENAVTDTEAFSSAWMSHQPRAVLLRLRDLSPLVEPARRALVSRPTVMCRRTGCTSQWERLKPDGDSDLVRWCATCESAVEMCSTIDDIQDRSRKKLPVAIDPGLVAERARIAYDFPYRDFDDPTVPRLMAVTDDDDL
jgi:uncharacterized protein (TIGR02996 family)